MTISDRNDAARRTRPRISPLCAALLGAIALLPVAAAHAQNVLSAYSQEGTGGTVTQSYDYRYTKHTISTGGRGSRPYTYYSWDPYLNQTTSLALPLPLGVTEQVASSGTFYGPTYSATAKGSSALANTPTRAVLTVKYTGATNVTTTLAAHQGVTVTAQPGGTFTFTVPANSDVVVSTFGSPSGVFRLFAPGAGVVLGPLYGTNSPISLDTPLAPGTYWVDSSLTYASGVDTQLVTSTNPGKTAASWGFTMTVTPNGDNGGGGGTGAATDPQKAVCRA